MQRVIFKARPDENAVGQAWGRSHVTVCGRLPLQLSRIYRQSVHIFILAPYNCNISVRRNRRGGPDRAVCFELPSQGPTLGQKAVDVRVVGPKKNACLVACKRWASPDPPPMSH